MNKKIALIDLDAMLHIVACVQFYSGNRDNDRITQNHIKSFINTIVKNSSCSSYILVFQGLDFKNFRKELLPEYKNNRVKSEAIQIWGDKIKEMFIAQNAFSLKYIESDDALSVLSKTIGYDKVIIITSDKDMKQIPVQIYNPYKANISIEDRWTTISLIEAYKFLNAQILTGDSTDMPNKLCGIEGVGLKTAYKILDSYPAEMPYYEIIQKVYTKKYGAKEGFKRASITYKMVKLLSDFTDYTSDVVNEEIKNLQLNYKLFINPVTNDVEELFSKTSTSSLFT